MTGPEHELGSDGGEDFTGDSMAGPAPSDASAESEPVYHRRPFGNWASARAQVDEGPSVWTRLRTSMSKLFRRGDSDDEIEFSDVDPDTENPESPAPELDAAMADDAAAAESRYAGHDESADPALGSAAHAVAARGFAETDDPRRPDYGGDVVDVPGQGAGDPAESDPFAPAASESDVVPPASEADLLFMDLDASSPSASVFSEAAPDEPLALAAMDIEPPEPVEPLSPLAMDLEPAEPAESRPTEEPVESRSMEEPVETSVSSIDPPVAPPSGFRFPWSRSRRPSAQPEAAASSSQAEVEREPATDASPDDSASSELVFLEGAPAQAAGDSAASSSNDLDEAMRQSDDGRAFDDAMDDMGDASAAQGMEESEPREPEPREPEPRPSRGLLSRLFGRRSRPEPVVDTPADLPAEAEPLEGAAVNEAAEAVDSMEIADTPAAANVAEDTADAALFEPVGSDDAGADVEALAASIADDDRRDTAEMEAVDEPGDEEPDPFEPAIEETSPDEPGDDRPGFFGRLFGRRKSVPAEPASAGGGGDWTSIDIGGVDAITPRDVPSEQPVADVAASYDSTPDPFTPIDLDAPPPDFGDTLDIAPAPAAAHESFDAGSATAAATIDGEISERTDEFAVPETPPPGTPEEDTAEVPPGPGLFARLFRRKRESGAEAAAQEVEPGFLHAKFRQFYSEILRFKNQKTQVAAGFQTAIVDYTADISPDATAMQLSNRLKELLELQSAEAAWMKGEYATRYPNAQYAMCALADEIFGELDWPGRESWPRHRLENRLFKTNDADVEFFKRVDRLLREENPTQEAKDLARVYLMVLASGFRGKWRPFGLTRPIADYRRRLYEFISGQDALLLYGDDHTLLPQTVKHTLAGHAVSRFTAAQRWTAALVVLLVVYVVVAHLAWTRVSADLQDLTARIVSTRAPGAP